MKRKRLKQFLCALLTVSMVAGQPLSLLAAEEAVTEVGAEGFSDAQEAVEDVDEEQVLDAQELCMDAIPEKVRGYFNGFVLGSVLSDYLNLLGKARRHDRSVRRYMWQVAY